MTIDQIFRGIGRSLVARSSLIGEPEYELFEDEVLGRGPLGTLYAGRDRRTSRIVALRVLPITYSKDGERRLREHARVLALLDREGLLPILGFGRWKDQLFYAMDYLAVGNLASLLGETHHFTTDEILQVALGAAHALRAAWKAGLSPCGLRPSNLFFTESGALRLVDAGVAGLFCAKPQGLHRPGPYVAPELLVGAAPDVRSDLYSLGAILYHLAAGKLPVDGYDSPASFEYQLLHVTPSPPHELGSTVPRSLERVLLRCLAKDPRERYPDPDSLLEVLESVRQQDALDPSSGEGEEDTGDFDIDLDHVVGEGGMGILYQARQRSLDRLVVVKVLRDLLTSNPDIVKRFRQEAELLAQVNHPNVVQIFGTGLWRKQLFYAMELVDGKDLATSLKEKKQFAAEEVLQVAEGVAQALSAAWGFKIIHRDIKPSNILLTKDGVIKVADFGLAKSLRIPRTDSRLIAGTSEYISPEQGMGRRVDIRSDLYSLGAVLYELLTGRPPFQEGESFTSTVYQHVHTAPPPLGLPRGSVPAGLEALVMKCLRKKPDQRYQTPEEFLEAIRKVRSGTLQSPGGESPSPGPIARGRRSWGRNAVAAAFLLVIAVGGGLGFSRTFGESPALGTPAAPEIESSAEVDVALFLEDFRQAESLAESRGGRASSDFLLAKAKEAEALRGRLLLRARESFREHDWRAAAAFLRTALEDVAPPGEREARAALQVATDLLRAQEEAGIGRRLEARRLYETCLQRLPGERVYLEEKIRSLGP